MIYYYLGYYNEKNGDNKEAQNYYRLGNEMPPKFCFPFRSESINVLSNHPDYILLQNEAHLSIRSGMENKI